jgi:flagellar hook assembly protein FlgD
MTTIGIYDLRGQLIRRLLNQSQSYGEYQVFWDGLDDEANSMPSGLYFCSICSGNWRSQIKMIKAK